MAIISFANINERFDNRDDNFIAPLLPLNNSTTSSTWEWNTDFANTGVVKLVGTDLTYSGDTITGGTIIAAGVNPSDNTGALSSDVSITGISFDATWLTPLFGSGLSADQQNNLFWRVILSGDDTIDLTGSGIFTAFAGDGMNVEAGQYIVGGVDTIKGESGGGRISGDFFTIAAGAVVFGGGDIMQSNGGSTSGDALNLSGTLYGGNDYMASRGSDIHGDVADMLNGGVLIGGNDFLIREGNGGLAFGDTRNLDTNQALIGGDDTLIGSNGNDSLFGDISGVFSSSLYFIGGDDMLMGGAGNDELYGDWSTNSLASAVGGNDSLFGGSGNDELFGNDGDDFLDGGSGTEITIDGGDGMDTISFLTAQGGASVALYLASDQVINDGYGNTETLISIESVVGSVFGDSIIGDGNNNVIQGGFGDDVIFAGFGNDFIDGGEGADYLNGSEGFDAFAFDLFDFTSGTFDIISDFSDSATSYDSLYLTSLMMTDLTIADFGGDVYVYTTATFDTGIIIQDFTAAQLDDQILFA